MVRFITGTSWGSRRLWTAAALERGDKVAATARDISTLDDLKQFGFVEEHSEQEARDEIETNLFAAPWITQAALRS